MQQQAQRQRGTRGATWRWVWIGILLSLISTPAAAQTVAGTIRAAGTACVQAPQPNPTCVVVPLRGASSVGITISGAGTYTLEFEVSVDGQTWIAPGAVNLASYARDASTTSPGTWSMGNLGFLYARVRASAYTSGTPRVSLTLGAGSVNAPLSAGSLSLSGADGAVLDGSNSAIRATVRDYANSDPLAVVLTNTSGDAYVASGGGGGGGAAQADNSALGDLTGAGALYDTTPPSITDGNVGAFRMSSDRYLYTIFPSAQAVSQSGAWSFTLGAALPAGTNNIGDVDVLTLPALPTGSNTIGGVNLAQYTPASGRLPVDGSGVTQPVSAASLPLPSGAATSANQTTLIGHVDGIETLIGTTNTNTSNAVTALQLIDNPVGSATGGTAGSSSFLAGGVYNSTPPTLTNGQQASVQLDAAGRVVMACGSGCSGSTTTDTDDGSIAGSQSVGLSGALNYVWNGSAWVRGTNADATHDSAAFATGPQMMAERDDALSTLTPAEGDAVRLLSNSRGALWTVLDTASITNLDVQIGGSDTVQVQSNSANLATQATAAAIQTAVELIDNAVSGAGFNVSQINGVTPLMGAGNTGTGSLRVTVASDQATIPVSLASVPSHAVTNAGTFAVQPAGSVAHDAAASGVNPVLVGGYASTAVPAAVSAATDSVRAWMTPNGAQVVASVDVCQRYPKVYLPISQATSTQLFTGTASNRTFICSISVMQRSTSTQTWALVSGTGTVCATSTSGLIGGATAADGTDLSVTQGDGTSAFLKTDTDADNVCLLQSGTDRLNGWITYVVAPNQ